MTTLIINNIRADLKAETSFKLTRSNPNVTSDGDYTWDISLPYTPNNIRIFGLQKRVEVSKRKLALLKYDFNLQADNINVYGQAVITGITEVDIRIQLLAGRSTLKSILCTEDGNPVYIDDLSLPGAYEKEFRALYGYKKEYTMQSVIDMLMRQPDFFFNPDIKMYGTSEQTDFLAFPIYSETDNAFSNPKGLAHFEKGSYDEYTWWSWPLSDNNVGHPLAQAQLTVPIDSVFAPQPYLCYLVEQIFTALGYTVVENYIRDSWMNQIFIANARGVLYMQLMLPHWTVEEFITHIESFCGVRIQISGNNIRIKDKNRAQDQPVIVLEKVIDTFSTDIEEAPKRDIISVGNVDYAFPDDLGELQIPDEIFTRANRLSFETINEVYDYYNSMPTEKIKASDTLFDAEGSYFATLTQSDGGWNLFEINQMEQLLQQSDRQTDIELKFVPVRSQYSLFTTKFFTYTPEYGYRFSHHTDDELVCMVTSDTRTQENYLAFSINDILKGSEKDRNKRDIIEVGINLQQKSHYIPGSGLDIEVNIAYGIPYARNESGRFTPLGPESHFQLSHKAQDTIRYRITSGVKYNTSTKVCISFIDDGYFEPDRIYLVNNKKYICEKIEYSISEKGVDKIKKGYFFEVES